MPLLITGANIEIGLIILYGVSMSVIGLRKTDDMINGIAYAIFIGSGVSSLFLAVALIFALAAQSV